MIDSYDYMIVDLKETYFIHSMAILCKLLVAKKFFLLKLLITSMNEGKKIYLTGHSLGGISALYLHIILTFLFKYENLETYIFGGFPIIPIHLKNDLRNLYYIMHMCDPVNEYNPIDRLLTNSIENIIYLTNSRMIFENKLAYLNYTKLANSQYNLKSKISIYYDSKFKTIEKNYIFHTYDAYSYEMHTAFHNYYNYYDINKNIDRRNNIIFIKIYNYFIMTRIGTIRKNQENIKDSKKNINELLTFINIRDNQKSDNQNTDINLMTITDDIIHMLSTIHKDIENLILNDAKKIVKMNEKIDTYKDKEKIEEYVMEIEYIKQKIKYFENSYNIINRLIKNKKNTNSIIMEGVEDMKKLDTSNNYFLTWWQDITTNASFMFYRWEEYITNFTKNTQDYITNIYKKYGNNNV